MTMVFVLSWALIFALCNAFVGPRDQFPAWFVWGPVVVVVAITLVTLATIASSVIQAFILAVSVGVAVAVYTEKDSDP